MAASEATLLRFDAPLDRASVEVEARATRFRWVDVGDTFMVLEPSVDLGADEKLVVRARYRDGASPAALTLTLVTRPAVVDKEVAVVRRARSREALEARVVELETRFTALKARCEEGALPNLAFSGLLNSSLTAKLFLVTATPGYHGGLKPEGGTGYRAARWGMVTVRVSNQAGQAPWAPTAARLTGVDGTAVKVRSLHMEKPQLLAGESALVVVVTERPIPRDERFLLELEDAAGAVLPIHVKL